MIGITVVLHNPSNDSLWVFRAQTLVDTLIRVLRCAPMVVDGMLFATFATKQRYPATLHSPCEISIVDRVVKAFRDEDSI